MADKSKSLAEEVPAAPETPAPKTPAPETPAPQDPTQPAQPNELRAYLAAIGRKGGMKSRRRLSPEQASLMVRLREAKKAYRKHHARCFWSFDPEYKITSSDLPWVAAQLIKHGDRSLWLLGKKLCR